MVKQCAEFMEYLREVEPMPAGVELQVELVKKASLERGVLGSPVLALFTAQRGENRAKLTVATRGRDLLSVLNSIGHEYYHALQWFRDGRFVVFEDGIDEFLDYEGEADGFGWRTAHQFAV
jgi:hypothetical protein